MTKKALTTAGALLTSTLMLILCGGIIAYVIGRTEPHPPQTRVTATLAQPDRTREMTAMPDAIEGTRARCNANAEANIVHYDELLQAMRNTNNRIIGASLQQLAPRSLCLWTEHFGSQKDCNNAGQRPPPLAECVSGNRRDRPQHSSRLWWWYPGADCATHSSGFGWRRGDDSLGASLNTFKTEEIISFRRMDREGQGQYALARMLHMIHEHVPDHMRPDYRARR